MPLSKYRAFSSAAQRNSLTKAANALKYTQSGVSHLIAALEEDFGVMLLHRSKKGAFLTKEGEMLFPYVERILAAEADLQVVLKNLRGIETGNLNIGTISSIAIRYLPQLLQGFRQSFPGIEISVMNGTYSDVEEAILQQSQDCGFVTLPSRSEFQTVALLKDRMLAIVHPSSSLAAYSQIPVSSLADEPFIMPAEGVNYDIGKLFTNVGIRPQVHMNMKDDFAALAMVRQGLGVTILPELLACSFPLEGVRTIPLERSEREVGLAFRTIQKASPLVRVFIQYTMDFFKAGIQGNE